MEEDRKVLVAKEYVKERTLFGYQGWYLARWQERFSEASKVLMVIRKKSYIGVKIPTLGYCDGAYPAEKPRKENRSKIIE